LQPRRSVWRIPKEWVGQTAAVFGGGPSLTQADVDYVIRRGWRRVACNNAYLLDPNAEVLCWSDQRWYNWNAKDIHRHKGPYKICWRPMRPTKGLTFMQLRHHNQPPGLSSDSSMIIAGNTGQGAINIAYLFGAKRIVLLGFDMRMVSGQHNWHNLHKGATSQNRYNGIFGPAITKAAVVLRQKGIEVLNTTKDSALKCFPYVPLRDIDPIPTEIVEPITLELVEAQVI